MPEGRPALSRARRRLFEYSLTILAVGLALLLRWSVDPLVGDHALFQTILGAVAVAVGFGGLYPALLATVLGYFAATFLFLGPQAATRFETSSDWIRLAGYLAACFTVILFGVLMRRLHQRQQSLARSLSQLNEQKNVLLITVAHELRNPLAAIRNAVAILRAEGSARPDSRQARDMIDRQVDHLTRIIDDLVAMDRIVRNQLDIRPKRLSLTATVERAIEASRSLLEQRRHELKVTLPEDPLSLDGDADRLEQVVVNLLSNAIKFTPPGGRIEIGLGREGRQATLRVKDSGIGITSEALPRLFEMFFQANSAQPGLGIGLTVVRQLVGMHGGSVSVRSAGANCGSEFIIRLPLAADDKRPEGLQPAEVASALAGDRHSIFVS